MASHHGPGPVDEGAAPARRFCDPVLAAFLILAAILLFWGLGRRDLWQDEAETAMLAKNILRFKLPIVFDGTNLVSSETGMEFGPDLLWRWSPWLQFYVTAGAMALGGFNAWAARLPFAFLGLLCLPLTFFFARRAFDSDRVARLSAVLLGLSVPFLLHCRQARWYALAYLLVIGLFFALFELEHRPKAASAALALCSTLLFYTNYFVAMGVLAALCVALPLLKPARTFWRGFAPALAAAALCALPGMSFFHVLGKAGPILPARAIGLLAAYAGLFFTQLLPMPMLVVLLWALQARRPPPLDAIHRQRAVFLLACAGCYVVYLSLGPWELFRYLSVLLPLCSVLLALALDRLWRVNRAGAAALLLLLVGTDVLHVLPLGRFGGEGVQLRDRFGRAGPFSFPLAGFAYEVTHDLHDCSRILVDCLKARARPRDVVLATYGDLPLQFYTGLKVVGGFQGQKLGLDPDWIVMRSSVIDRRPGRDYDVARFILLRIDLTRYEEVALPCRDFMLAGCVEPHLHLFREPRDGHALRLLHRKPGSQAG